MDIIRISLAVAGLLCIVFLLPSCIFFSIWQKKKLHAVFKKSKIDPLLNFVYLFETRQKSGIHIFEVSLKGSCRYFYFFFWKFEIVTERKINFVIFYYKKLLIISGCFSSITG